MYQGYNSLELTEEQSTEPPGLLAITRQGYRPKSTPISKNSENWNDWKWQIKNRIRTFEQLVTFLPELSGNDELRQVIQKYPMAVTPYYASLIQKPDVTDPVFMMSVPQTEELFNPPCLSEDPLEEHKDMPVPGMVHRYQDRALVITTTTCSSYCRHCTRKRIAGTRECSISPRRLQQITEYLLNHPEISDVIVSGGDPLTMTTDALENVLAALRSVPTVQVIRIGSRVPVVMPMRITDELVQMIRKYHPVWVNTHFNHPNELTEESSQALARLADAGIPLGNQSVLLKGVNDSPEIIEKLCRGLIKNRVRPYYLYQCDLVRGVEHFRTPLSKGIEIMEYMRGRVSGMAIPTFVVDAPHGGGKIPVLPTYVVSSSPTNTVIRNYEGMLVNYPEPGGIMQQVPEAKELPNPGVWELASGRASIIQPSSTSRGNRRKKLVEKQQKSPTAVFDTSSLLFEV